MVEYIEREKVIELIDYHQEEYFEAETYFELLKEDFMQLPSADVVSKAAYDQVAWERHLAEVQLKNIGKSIGEKMDDVQPIVRCKDCKHFHLDYFEEVYGVNIIVAHEICDFWAGGCRTMQNAFCSNGAKMDGEDNG